MFICIALNFINQIKKSFKSIDLLPKELRNRTYLVQFFSIVSAVLDIIGLGSMVPVLMLAIDKNFLDKSGKLRYIYDLFGFSSEAEFLVFLLISIFFFFLLKNLFALWVQKLTAILASKANIFLSRNAYDHAFQNITYSQVSKDGLGFNDQIIFNPFYYISGVFLPLLVIISEGTVTLLMIVLFCVFKPIMFIPVAFLMGIAIFIVMTYFKRKSQQLGIEIGNKRDESLNSLNYGHQGFFDIRNYKAQPFFKRRFFNFYGPFVNKGAQANLLLLLPSRTLELVTLSGIILLVVYAYFISDNIGQARAIAAMFVIAIFRLLPAANRLMQSFLKIRLNSYTINRLKEDTQIIKPSNLVFKELMEVENINYSYEDSVILEDGNIVLQRGKIVGVRGESGAGKTSLIRFLLGEISSKNSVYKLDGKEASVLDISSLIGSLGQQHFVFQGSVAQNITLREHANDVDLVKLEEAIQDSNFSIDGISDLKNHQLENEGVNLSEGQKQRLSIARLLYADNPVVLLDEPTSALDFDNEKEIIKTVNNLAKKGKAILIIAHGERMFEICNSIYEISEKKLLKIK